ncbi:MAG TPA: glycosyl hydrolase, partial [Bacteroidia bacterium]|nr:glycosyl hydrolase [Bacteroidia bacterium]
MKLKQFLLLPCFFPAFLSAQPTAPEPRPTPAAEVLAGIEKGKAAELRSVARNVTLQSIGPTIMSGRVVDIEADPNDPSHFYVAYASGGVWFTDNNGTSFTPVFDEPPTNDIGAIAVEWTKENDGKATIWVGTGEANS